MSRQIKSTAPGPTYPVLGNRFSMKDERGNEVGSMELLPNGALRVQNHRIWTHLYVSADEMREMGMWLVNQADAQDGREIR